MKNITMVTCLGAGSSEKISGVVGALNSYEWINILNWNPRYPVYDLMEAHKPDILLTEGMVILSVPGLLEAISEYNVKLVVITDELIPNEIKEVVSLLYDGTGGKISENDKDYVVFPMSANMDFRDAKEQDDYQIDLCFVSNSHPEIHPEIEKLQNENIGVRFYSRRDGDGLVSNVFVGSLTCLEEEMTAISSSGCYISFTQTDDSILNSLLCNTPILTNSTLIPDEICIRYEPNSKSIAKAVMAAKGSGVNFPRALDFIFDNNTYNHRAAEIMKALNYKEQLKEIMSDIETLKGSCS